MNTQLQDFYGSLDAFCEDKNADRKELEEKLDVNRLCCMIRLRTSLSKKRKEESMF